MTRGPVVRAAGREDASLLRRIFLESHCGGWELLHPEETAYEQLAEIQLAARGSQYRSAYPGSDEQVIDVAGTGVGSCWVAETTREVRVLDLAVLTSHRRTGVARAVLCQITADAASRGKPVRLSVWQDNEAAHALYRSLGFRPRTLGPGMTTTPGYLELEQGVGAWATTDAVAHG